jgi:hypothetical protein
MLFRPRLEPLGWIFFGSPARRRREKKLTATFSFNNEGTRGRCAFACKAPFRKQEQHRTTRTQPGLRSSQSDQCRRQGQGGLRPGCFRCAFVPWRRGGGSCTTYRRRRPQAQNLLLSLHGVLPGFRGPKWPGCERQEVAPQAGKQMRSYVAVSSSCCLLYLLFQRGSQGGRARGVTAAVAAFPFLLACASDFPRCLMSQSQSLHDVHVAPPLAQGRSQGDVRAPSGR